MCGGAILANLIPPRKPGRIAPSDIWPNVKFNPFESNLSRLGHADPAPLKRPQPASGKHPLFYSYFVSENKKIQI